MDKSNDHVLLSACVKARFTETQPWKIFPVCVVWVCVCVCARACEGNCRIVRAIELTCLILLLLK